MAKKKQRRRREKERRHEYEYVYVDAEGREVEVEDGNREPSDDKTKSQKQAPVKGRPGRPVEPPSWRRTFRRAALFAPFMLIVLYLLRPKGSSPAAVVFQLLVLMAFFVPFSFFMDSLMYRLARKRIERGSSAKGGSSR